MIAVPYKLLMLPLRLLDDDWKQMSYPSYAPLNIEPYHPGTRRRVPLSNIGKRVHQIRTYLLMKRQNM